jgi:hypothetical protein
MTAAAFSLIILLPRKISAAAGSKLVISLAENSPTDEPNQATAV